ncbi:phosphoethanolamine transferase [Pseudoxanthomonas koreensis]|uniref:phosphoethanolamine transferase n=1 Tax=Pseudoxanthomonas koreensis TaxID=266061 RepID=UPI0013912012|nr:phosphoethanolamine transferase [Pseudoxanthomonas koreensis]
MASFAGLLLIQAIPLIQLLVVNHRGLPPSELLVLAGASVLGLLVQAFLFLLCPRISLVLAASLSLLALLEIWFIREFGWPLDGNALSLVIETNIAEARDLLWSLSLGWPVCAVLVVALLCAMAWRPPVAQGQLRSAAIRLLILASMGLLGLVYLDWFETGAEAQDSNPIFSSDPQGSRQALRGSFPVGVLWVLSDFANARRELDRAIKASKDYRFGVSPLPAQSKRRVYVYVVGETTRGDHLGLNGYWRDTTPKLAAREGVVSFHRMYTMSTFTRLSVPVLLSRKPPGDDMAIFSEASIVTAFKEAGFDTTWISLQAPIGYYESPVSLLAAEADRKVFLNPVDYRNSGRYDDAAVLALSAALRDGKGRDQFIVIHLLGSHFQYVDRYPEGFGKFLPDRPVGRSARLFSEDDKPYLLNAYDNTVLFQDSVLDEIIGILAVDQDAESWMMYSSDHGEAIFDDCRKFSGHGMASSATQNVAAVFWASPAYIASHAAKVTAMRQRADALISTSMMFETLSDLGGLHVPGGRPNNSLAGPVLRHPDEVAGIEGAEGGVCRS